MFSVLAAILAVAVVTRLLAATIPDALVTSWWRSWNKNESLRANGSAPFSAHLLGWAVDLIPANPATEEAARSRFPFVYPEGDHIHAAVFQA